MLLTFSAAISSSGQCTRIYQCHPGSVSLIIKSAHIAERNAHGEICLEAGVLRISASLSQQDLGFRDGHVQPLGKGVYGQGAEKVRHVLTIRSPNLFLPRI